MADWLDQLRRYPIPGLTCPELAVLRAIAERSDYATGRNARPSMRTIGWASALGVAAARRAVRVLEARGLVVAEVGGGRSSTRYVVVVDAVVAMIRLARPGSSAIAASAHLDRSDRGARSERSTTTTKTTTVTTSPRPLVDQLALALLEIVGGGIDTSTPTERADALAAAVELDAAGVGVDDVPALVSGWAALGWDPAKITTGALRRHRGKLLREGRRANARRDRHTQAADLTRWEPPPPEVVDAGLAAARAARRAAKP